MAQDAITRSELDADQARQDVTFTEAIYQMRDDFRNAMHQLERRIYLVVALATGLIIGAMQID